MTTMFSSGFKKLFYLLPVGALILVIYLGFQPGWYRPLVGDVKYYYSLADYFFTHHALQGYKDPIAYPPGANSFFFLVGAVLFLNHSFSVYQNVLIAANIFFLLVLVKISHDYNSSQNTHRNLVVFSLITLACGPLILFRFDLLVVLFTALAIKSFRDSRLSRSGFYLALATLTKIFPLVLLPYFFLLTFKKERQFLPVVKLGFVFLSTLVIGLVLYIVIFKDPPSSVIAMINYNFTKSVHIESPLGSFLTGIAMIKNPGLHTIDFINGLFILTPGYLLGHPKVFRFTNSAGLILIYSLILLRFRKLAKLSLSICLIIILSLLVTSQVVSPQYLIWPFFLFPMLAPSELATGFWKINIVLICLALILTQYVYPLNYDTFIFNFYGSGHDWQFFWAIAIRNFLLAFLTVRLIKNNLFNKSE